VTTASESVRPPPAGAGPAGWAKKNLFSTWYNTLLTVVMAGLVVLSLNAILTWAVGSADWSPVSSNLKLFAVGQYPSDEVWRAWTSLLIASFLVGLSWRVWGGVARTFARVLAVAFGAMAVLPLDLDILGLEARLWLLGNPALIAAGYFFASVPVVRPRWVLWGWLLAFGLALVLLRGIPGIPWLPSVETGKWGGLLLTFLLAVVGIVASFPLGVLLALGRRSRLPALSIFSTLFIELVRGVPLVSLLFMAQIILPLFLPEDVRIDRVLRALIAITLFSAAYMAENVRGGLQAVPRGQIEAAKALGLSGPQVMLYIVLPQALRAVIPAIVGQFISLFKDTSLVVIVGMLDIVGIGKSVVLGNVQWIGSQREVYVFLAAVFWVFTFSMSYASRRLEEALGVGKR
jgi:general L-amino acid transport system permease protein